MTKQYKILLIEDDEDFLTIYTEAFKNAEIWVDIAKNGKDGMTLLDKGGYSAVLMDIMLPDINGMDILKKHQQNMNAGLNGPIIVITNLPQSSVCEKLKEVGVTNCMDKTEVNPEQLVDNIKKIIERQPRT